MALTVKESIEFRPGYIDPSDEDSRKYYFIFHDQSILVRNESGKSVIPDDRDLAESGFELREPFYFGSMNDSPCYVIRLEESTDLPNNYSLLNLRSIFGLWNDDLFWIAGRAYHLGRWINESNYCGRCGDKTELKFDEISKVCTNCGLTIFPRVSPAVIMAVIKDGRILLANNNRWYNSMYSVLAGFVEVGESLEECVRREVKEETALDIKNIRYFGSQPWHFSGSLMIAFTADYAGGEMKLDKSELSNGGWYAPGNLPEISRKPSISRQLIDWFVESYDK